MRHRPEYNYPLSPVGVILDRLQKEHEKKNDRLQYDTALTKHNPNIYASLISRVRYGKQCPTPLFIRTIIEVYNPENSVVKSLIRAMYEMFKMVRMLRIPTRLSYANRLASDYLSALYEKLDPIAKIRAFTSKWTTKIKRVLEVFSNVLSGFGAMNYVGGRFFTRVPVNAY